MPLFCSEYSHGLLLRADSGLTKLTELTRLNRQSGILGQMHVRGCGGDDCRLGSQPSGQDTIQAVEHALPATAVLMRSTQAIPGPSQTSPNRASTASTIWPALPRSQRRARPMLIGKRPGGSRKDCASARKRSRGSCGASRTFLHQGSRQAHPKRRQGGVGWAGQPIYLSEPFRANAGRASAGNWRQSRSESR